jgi:hypothetical protein
MVSGNIPYDLQKAIPFLCDEQKAHSETNRQVATGSMPPPPQIS